MPRWSRQKRGREGRAHAPRRRRQPLPPSRRCGRAAARDRALGRQRERAALPAAAAGAPRRSRDPSARALGRPRLCLARARAGAGRAPDPLPHQPAPPARAADPARTASYEVWRGKKRRLKTRDPQARQRWAVERTNAWLKALRRIATRRDRKADNYLAFLELGMIVILVRSF